jgi:tetratricopeptide (TPR) repeat protein
MESNRLEKLLELQKLYPDDLFNKYAVAMEYLGLSKTSMAKEIFEEVLKNDKNYVPAYYQLGMILMNEGNENKALELFEKGLSEAKLKKDGRSIREFQAAIDELTL